MSDQILREGLEQSCAEHESDYCTVATIGSAYGLEGWMRITVRCESIDQLLKFEKLFINTVQHGEKVQRGEKRNLSASNQTHRHWYPFEFEQVKVHSKGLIAKISGCNIKEEVALFTGKDIGVLQTDLPELAVGDYYWSDLIDMVVCSTAGEIYGTVEGLIETGANDVLIVQPSPTSIDEKERLIPYLVDSVVKSVDKGGNRISVEWDSDF